MNLQTKLQILMTKKKVTRAMLSKLANIPYSTIDSLLKRGDSDRVKISTMNALKNYFNVSLDFLLVDEIEDPDYGKPQLPITQQEYTLVIAYRNNPEMQPAINRLLNLNDVSLTENIPEISKKICYPNSNTIDG